MTFLTKNDLPEVFYLEAIMSCPDFFDKKDLMGFLKYSVVDKHDGLLPTEGYFGISRTFDAACFQYYYHFNTIIGKRLRQVVDANYDITGPLRVRYYEEPQMYYVDLYA